VKHYAGEFIVGVFILAIVYVLVRPRSKGVELVTAFGAMVTAITSAATDLANPDS
jgi:hypothetical protein